MTTLLRQLHLHGLDQTLDQVKAVGHLLRSWRPAISSLRINTIAMSSRSRELHPEPLTEPCVTLSIYTALVVQPWSRNTRQWTKIPGQSFFTLASHSTLRRLCRINVLYLRLAHCSSLLSTYRKGSRIAVG